MVGDATADPRQHVRCGGAADMSRPAILTQRSSPAARRSPVLFRSGTRVSRKSLDVGEHVRSVSPGERVVVPFQISCGQCGPCLAGHTSNCVTVPRASTYGFGPQVQRYGGFSADVVLVPFADHMLVPVPEGLSPVAVASVSDSIPDRLARRRSGTRSLPQAEVLIVGGRGRSASTPQALPSPSVPSACCT